MNYSLEIKPKNRENLCPDKTYMEEGGREGTDENKIDAVSR